MPAYSLKKYTYFSLIFTVGALLALALPAGNSLGWLLTLAYFLGHGWLLGNRWLADEPRRWRLFLGTLIAIAGVIVFASLIYYLYRLDVATTAVVLTATPLLGLLIRPFGASATGLFGRPGVEKPATARGRTSAVGFVLLAVSLALIAYGHGLLSAAAMTDAVRSPWDSVPRLFFVVFFLAALGVIAVAASGSLGEWSLLGLVGIGWLMTGVAVAVYAVGFGFDPFIHEATEKSIFQFGLITPKPFYYVGQYSLAIVLARLTKFGVTAIDTALVPLAFLLTLPTAYWSLKKSFSWPGATSAAASLGLLLWPLASFVATTPQGLANVLALLTFCLALPLAVGQPMSRLPILAVAGAAIFVHPLTGIPLAIFVATLLYLASRHGQHRSWTSWFIPAGLALIGAVALPLAFIVNAKLSGAGVSLNDALLHAPAATLADIQLGAGLVTRRFLAAFDFAYFWRASREIALFAAGLVGLVWLIRRHRPVAAYAIALFVCLADYLLLKTVVKFPFLIEYERSAYADRLRELALFLLAPLAIYALGRLWQRMREIGTPTVRIGGAVLLALLLTSSIYLAYPRRDLYESSRGWSTSAADIQAVRLIDVDAAGRPYVVLANQAVSAAAVREFGFKKYFQSRDPERPGQLFFYPIPTGDALYAEFLNLNDALGSSAVARQALDLAGAETAYYVVTNYWWQAQKIISNAKRQADAWWSVNDTDYVFRYDRR